MTSQPQMVVRVAASLEELRRNLREGRDQIETTTAALKKMAAGLDGSKLEQRAHNIAAAINEIGGITRLTDREQARFNATLQAYIEKAERMGRTVPSAIREIAQATQAAEDRIKAASDSTTAWSKAFDLVKGFLPVLTVTGLVGAIGSYMRTAVDAAGATLDLAAKTRTSTDAIQRYQEVANQTGSSVEAFVSAQFKLTNNIAQGSQRVREATQALGLSFVELQKQTPEQKFELVIKRLEQIDDVNLRTRLGVELFGKSFEQIASAVEQGYSQIADAAEIATREQLEAIDELGDEWQKFLDDTLTRAQRVLGWIVKSIKEGAKTPASPAAMSEASAQLSPEFIRQWEALRAAGLSAEEAAKKLAELRERQRDIELSTPPVTEATRDWAQELEAVRQKVRELDPATRVQLDAALKLVGATQEVADQFSLTQEELRAYQEYLRETAERKKELEKKTQELEAAQKKFIESIRPLNRELIGLKGSVADVGAVMHNLWSQSIAEAGAEQAKLNKELEEWAQANGAIYPSVQQVASATEEAHENTEEWDESVSELAQSFAQLSQVAGGSLGSIVGGIARVLTSLDAGIKSVQTFRAGFSQGFSLGGIAQMASGIVGMIGAVGSLFSGWFGVSQEIKQARSELESFQATIRSVATEEQRAAANGEQWALDVIVIRDAMLSLGRTEEEALRLAEAMWDTDNPERSKAAIEEVNRVLEQSKRRTEEVANAQRELTRLQEQGKYTFAEMQEDARTLGINFEALGGVFRAAQIDDTAQRYTQAIDRMIRASGDPGHILSQSAESISKLVQEAREAGVALPANMKPWIEELARAGLLVDENGEALEGLEDLQFGEAIKTEFELIQEAIEDLVDVIRGPLTDALTNLPRPSVDWSGMAPPGLPEPIPMAKGGDFVVSRPTLFVAGEAGPERATFTPLGSSGGGRTNHVTVMLPNARPLLDFIIDEAGDVFAVRGR